MLPDMTTAAIAPKALAAAKLRERRLHIRKLRRTVVAIAIALLLAMWAVIFLQLVTGHDPVLVAKAQAATSSGSTSSGSTSTGSTSTGASAASGSSSTSSSTSSGSGSSGVGATTSVVTRQS
jgi:cytoskeletal protein RodZ